MAQKHDPSDLAVMTSMGQLNGRMDRIDQRIAHIETRLDINDTAAD